MFSAQENSTEADGGAWSSLLQRIWVRVCASVDTLEQRISHLSGANSTSRWSVPRVILGCECGEHALAGLLATTTRLGADSAMLHAMRGMKLALVAAGLACRGAGL